MFVTADADLSTTCFVDVVVVTAASVENAYYQWKCHLMAVAFLDSCIRWPSLTVPTKKPEVGGQQPPAAVYLIPHELAWPVEVVRGRRNVFEFFFVRSTNRWGDA